MLYPYLVVHWSRSNGGLNCAIFKRICIKFDSRRLFRSLPTFFGRRWDSSGVADGFVRADVRLIWYLISEISKLDQLFFKAYSIYSNVWFENHICLKVLICPLIIFKRIYHFKAQISIAAAASGYAKILAAFILTFLSIHFRAVQKLPWIIIYHYLLLHDSGVVNGFESKLNCKRIASNLNSQRFEIR